MRSEDVVIVGAGPAGLSAALSLAHCGVSSTVIGAPHRPAGSKPDTRTAALFSPSIQLLENIGVWQHCRTACEPLRAIRLIDETGGIFRAPEVVFRSSEIGLEEFGWNVPQTALIDALANAASGHALIQVCNTAGVENVTTTDEYVDLRLTEGELVRARLAIAADGRRSVARQGAGIAVSDKPSGQTAVTCAFTHSRPHDGISSEFHRNAGPMTVVPMPGRRSSLVWVEKPEVAERLMELDGERFTRTLETNLSGLLGTIGEVGLRNAFPLSHMTADAMARNRVALVGEAAHAMPPIGAQGLNLSLRDCAALADLLGNSAGAGSDPGAQDIMTAYDRARRPDAAQRSFAVATLNGALLSELPAVHLARGAGLHAIRAIPSLRRILMQLGIAPPARLPPLMHPPPAA